MNELQKAVEMYNQRVKQNPNYAQKVIDEWREDMPEQFTDYIYRTEYGCHIVNEDFYNKAVHLLKWADEKGSGPKWKMEDIIRLSDIKFDDKDYYPLDYCYVVNMLYSDYCNIFTEPTYYLRMAKNYLEDNDYMGNASERAYKNAKKRIRYFS